MVLGDCLLDDLVMGGQQSQGTGFIAAHLAAKADDVGKHDRGQPPLLRLRCAASVILHESDYSAGNDLLSTDSLRPGVETFG
jgi:hypothetical protein